MRTLHACLSFFAFLAIFAAGLASAQDSIQRVSVNPHWRAADGDSIAYPGQGSLPSVSADGKWIVFDSLASNLCPESAPGASDVFVQEVATGRILNLTHYSVFVAAITNGSSYAPSISADGRFVAFTSDATNLDANITDSNGCSDVYVADRDPEGNGIFDEYLPLCARVSVDSLGA